MNSPEYPTIQLSGDYFDDVTEYMERLQESYDATVSAHEMSETVGHDTDPTILQENIGNLVMLSLDTQRAETGLMQAIVDDNRLAVSRFNERHSSDAPQKTAINDLGRFYKDWNVALNAADGLLFTNAAIHEIAQSDDEVAHQDNKKYIDLREQLEATREIVAKQAASVYVDEIEGLLQGTLDPIEKGLVQTIIYFLDSGESFRKADVLHFVNQLHDAEMAYLPGYVYGPKRQLMLDVSQRIFDGMIELAPDPDNRNKLFATLRHPVSANPKEQDLAPSSDLDSTESYIDDLEALLGPLSQAERIVVQGLLLSSNEGQPFNKDMVRELDPNIVDNDNETEYYNQRAIMLEIFKRRYADRFELTQLTNTHDGIIVENKTS